MEALYHGTSMIVREYRFLCVTRFMHVLLFSPFVWLSLIVNDRKFPAGTIFFSHTNQPAVLLHEPATKRTSQPNRLIMGGGHHICWWLTEMLIYELVPLIRWSSDAIHLPFDLVTIPSTWTYFSLALLSSLLSMAIGCDCVVLRFVCMPN